MSNKKFNMDNFLMKDFVKRLNKAREQLGLSVNEISNMIGMEVNSYYKYEDGSRFPRPEILSAISNKLLKCLRRPGGALFEKTAPPWTPL